MFYEDTQKLQSRARQINRASQRIATINTDLFGTDNQVIFFGSEASLLEYRIPIPDKFREEFLRKMLDYYVSEYNMLIESLEPIKL